MKTLLQLHTSLLRQTFYNGSLLNNHLDYMTAGTLTGVEAPVKGFDRDHRRFLIIMPVVHYKESYGSRSKHPSFLLTYQKHPVDTSEWVMGFPSDPVFFDRDGLPKSDLLSSIISKECISLKGDTGIWVFNEKKFRSIVSNA